MGRLEEDISAESATPARDIYTTESVAAAAAGTASVRKESRDEELLCG